MKNESSLTALSILILSILMLCFENRVEGQIPSGFVAVSEFIPDASVALRYYSTNNFIGDTIDGYKANKLYISIEAAMALLVAQRKFKALSFGLKFFDAYRPQKAVDHFVRWAKILDDKKMKLIFYPNVPKSELFQRGYIASKSGHSRGSTADLTIINLKTGEELDMGSSFDLFDSKSHHNSPLISEVQLKNRNILKSVLIGAGFKPYTEEWWHYTLANEPYPKTYFDFDIE